MEEENRGRYNEFKKERKTIFADIMGFLTMILTYLWNMEKDARYTHTHVVDTSEESVKSLIRSLFQIHALYGFPTNEDDVIEKFAVGRLLHEIKIRNEQDAFITFAYYHEEIQMLEFWESIFREISTEMFNQESGLLHREPAHIFLQMVRSVCSNNPHPGVFGQQWLEALNDKNKLKPFMWAELRSSNNGDRYGVSLGVRSFVQPLYLFTKLRQIIQLENVEIVQLNNVKATQIKYKKEKNCFQRHPCLSCANTFGGLSPAPLGNCAEYDVVRYVRPDLLETNEWQSFTTACAQHFNAFIEMFRQVGSNLPFEEILHTYFHRTRSPNRPTVLKYEWNSESNVYEIILTPDWPMPRTQQIN